MLATAHLFLKVKGHMANDDEEEEKTPEAPKEALPSAMLLQKKILLDALAMFLQWPLVRYS